MLAGNAVTFLPRPLFPVSPGRPAGHRRARPAAERDPAGVPHPVGHRACRADLADRLGEFGRDHPGPFHRPTRDRARAVAACGVRACPARPNSRGGAARTRARPLDPSHAASAGPFEAGTGAADRSRDLAYREAGPGRAPRASAGVEAAGAGTVHRHPARRASHPDPEVGAGRQTGLPPSAADGLVAGRAPAPPAAGWVPQRPGGEPDRLAAGADQDRRPWHRRDHRGRPGVRVEGAVDGRLFDRPVERAGEPCPGPSRTAGPRAGPGRTRHRPRACRAPAVIGPCA